MAVPKAKLPPGPPESKALVKRGESRHGVCRTCRTVVDDGRDCPHSSEHAVVSLRDRNGRNKLLGEVWGTLWVEIALGPLSTQANAVWATALLLALLMVVSPASGLYVAVGLGPAAILVNFIAMWLGSLGLRKARGAAIAFDDILTLHGGARIAGLLTEGRAAVVGKISETTPMQAPLSRRECVAYAVVLRARRFKQGPILLRDTGNVAFEVITAEGERVRVPAGKLLMADASRPVRAPTQTVTRYLQGVDPYYALNASDDELNPFPWDDACEDILQVGNDVELFGDFELTIDPSAAPTHFRESAATIVMAKGAVYGRLKGKNS